VKTFSLPAVVGLVCGVAFGQGPEGKPDVIQRAMHDELTRSMTLRLTNLEPPYFVAYELSDVREFAASASLGGLVSSGETHFRQPRVYMRVGDYKFDNTDYVGSGFNFGPRYDLRMPLEDSYAVLRQDFWLATDSAYKSALEAIARKRAALKNVSITDSLPDFAAAKTFKLIQQPVDHPLLGEDWTKRIRVLSKEFAGFPTLKSSGAEVTLLNGTHYYMNSEGTEFRLNEPVAYLRLRAWAQAPDGMLMRDTAMFQVRAAEELPNDNILVQAAKDLAQRVIALAAAPMGENYSGPVLFEGQAGPQLFAEVLGRNLALSRKPVLEPGQPGAIPTSELEGRIGARVMPEFLNVVDDPTKKDWKGAPLLGTYEVDDEGVPPAPLTIIEKGTFKNYELTRQPMRGFSGSNGHARLPGSFGAKSAVPGNLLVSATEVSSPAELKKKLIEMCAQREKPYGIIVRKMDFPSSASVDEARRVLGSSQAGGSHATSLPLLVYRVYRDGHEELVRGMKFRGLNVRTFKDVLAAGDDSNVLNYMENGAPFALMGLGAEFSHVSVVAPSILIDDLEMLKIEEELPKLPIVPSPLLNQTASR
jgi:TldD protein